MMNYCCVRTADPYVRKTDQTTLKEMVPSKNVLPQSFHHEPEEKLCDSVFADEEEEEEEEEEGPFDFYLAVAEADLVDFGIPFRRMVQERMNLRPCLTERHILPGTAKYETMARFLETRCGGKVVFVVSDNFAASEECQFLVQFAKTLDPFAMEQKLIPLVIDKHAPVPRVLEGLTVINYNSALREKWLGKRLWEAIHGTSERHFSV